VARTARGDYELPQIPYLELEGEGSGRGGKRNVRGRERGKGKWERVGGRREGEGTLHRPTLR